jgi:serine O-acetyltransferase
VSTTELRATLRSDFAADPHPWDRITLVIFRVGQWAGAARRRRLPAWILWKLADVLYLRLLIGAELPPQVRCGPGLVLRHAGRGTIFHPGVRIGARARIYHRVTLGVADHGGPPTLGDDVYIGVGASVLGELQIGDGARIGAGAVVVTRDVPPGHVAVGVPARAHPLGNSSDAD